MNKAKLNVFAKFTLGMTLALSPIQLIGAEGLEPYSSRPSIDAVEPAGSELNSKARKLLKGLVDFIIEMRAFYPNSTFYILARDGEPIFDLWQLLFPEDFGKKRVKLINISRSSYASENFTEYLESTGLPNEARKGRHLVVLDSGYEGSIVNAINAYLKDDGVKLYAHLMSSAHPEIPSSRVSTRTFLATAKRRDVADGDYVSEAAELAVEQLENIVHYTETASDYQKYRGGWQPTSVSTDEKTKIAALAFTAGVKRYALARERKAEVAQTEKLFARVIGMIQAPNALKKAEIEALTADLKEAELEDVWADLRESIGKGTLSQYNPSRVAELFYHLPAKLKALNDIDEEEGLGAVEEREAEIAQLAATQKSDSFWVADIIRLYRSGIEPQELRARGRLHKQFMDEFESFSRPVRGDAGTVGEKLGEGVRSDVYELGKARVIKVAYEAEDMTALEGEALVFEFLKDNAERYPIRLLPVLEKGEKGLFLIKSRVKKDSIGKYILRKNGKLSAAQLHGLEKVYEVSRQLAEDTGISLDIKSDNLFWADGAWNILDLGPRTMSHPYFFTLERKSFQEYLEIWDSDSSSRSGVMDVEDYIRQSQRECEAAVIKGYRELKADQ